MSKKKSTQRGSHAHGNRAGCHPAGPIRTHRDWSQPSTESARHTSGRLLGPLCSGWPQDCQRAVLLGLATFHHLIFKSPSTSELRAIRAGDAELIVIGGSTRYRMDVGSFASSYNQTRPHLGQCIVTVVCVRIATVVYLSPQSGLEQGRGIAGGSTLIGRDI